MTEPIYSGPTLAELRELAERAKRIKDALAPKETGTTAVDVVGILLLCDALLPLIERVEAPERRLRDEVTRSNEMLDGLRGDYERACEQHEADAERIRELEAKISLAHSVLNQDSGGAANQRSPGVDNHEAAQGGSALRGQDLSSRIQKLKTEIERLEDIANDPHLCDLEIAEAVRQARVEMRSKAAGIVHDLFRQGRLITEVEAAIRALPDEPPAKEGEPTP